MGGTQSQTSSIIARDEGKLAELGYAPQLQRNLSFWTNFGATFGIVVSFQILLVFSRVCIIGIMIC